jgi:hypothetical protein
MFVKNHAIEHRPFLLKLHGDLGVHNRQLERALGVDAARIHGTGKPLRSWRTSGLPNANEVPSACATSRCRGLRIRRNGFCTPRGSPAKRLFLTPALCLIADKGGPYRIVAEFCFLAESVMRLLWTSDGRLVGGGTDS